MSLIDQPVTLQAIRNYCVDRTYTSSTPVIREWFSAAANCIEAAINNESAHLHTIEQLREVRAEAASLRNELGRLMIAHSHHEMT